MPVDSMVPSNSTGIKRCRLKKKRLATVFSVRPARAIRDSEIGMQMILMHSQNPVFVVQNEVLGDPIAHAK